MAPTTHSGCSPERFVYPGYPDMLIEGVHVWHIMRDPTVQIDWFRHTKEIRAHCARHRLNLDNYQTTGIKELHDALGINAYGQAVLERLAPSIKRAIREQLIFLARKAIITNFKQPDGSWAAAWPAYTNEWLGPDWSGSLEPPMVNERHDAQPQILTSQSYPEGRYLKSRNALRVTRTPAGVFAGPPPHATDHPLRSVPGHLGPGGVPLTPQPVDPEDTAPQASNQGRTWARMPTFKFTFSSPQAQPQRLPLTQNPPFILQRHSNSPLSQAVEQPATVTPTAPTNRIFQPEPPSRPTNNWSEESASPVQPLEAIPGYLQRRSSTTSLPASPPPSSRTSRFPNDFLQLMVPREAYLAKKAQRSPPDLPEISAPYTRSADLRTQILALERLQLVCRLQGWPCTKTGREEALKDSIDSIQTLRALKLEEIDHNNNAFRAKVSKQTQ